MKKFNWSLVLILATLLTVGGAVAAGDFEGEVDMQMTTHNGKTIDLQYFVKGHRTRTQMNTNDGKYASGAVYDWQTKQMIVMMDKQKMYMVSQLHPEKYHYGDNKHYKVTKTGNTENILGYTCQEWDYSSDDDSGKVWLAPGIGNWWGNQMAAQSDKLPAEQRALLNTVVSQKLFPMKWETFDKSGKDWGHAVVTKVESKSLSASLFEPPAGYKKFDMGNMLGGAGNQGGNNGQSENKDILSNVKPKLPF